jgi:hypothetical protein
MTHVVGGPVWVVRQRLSSISRFIVFAVGSTVAGGLAGVMLGAAMRTPPPVRVAFPAVAALLLARELFFRHIPLPQVRAQVPAMLRGRAFAGPLLYGSILGAGILTYIPSALVHLYVLALLAFATPAQGLMAGAAFGGTYAISVLLLGRRTATTHPLEQATAVKRFVLAARRSSIALAAVAAATLILFP